MLRQEGYRVALVNSNPATIMTDPEFADRTYIEPLTPESVLAVIERERPDALLPTIGGQTGLNVSVALAESGDLDRLGVELIGANLETIHRAEDRSGFKETMTKAGLDVPRAGTAHTLEEALGLGDALGFPVIVRPSFTLGGGGSGFAASPAELAALARRSLAASPVSEVLVEESIAGWKEFELEVMRDGADNAVDRVLDREHRSDGRPHGRLRHGRAATDAHGPRVPGDARRRPRVPASDRRGDRGVERPVRRGSATPGAGC